MVSQQIHWFPVLISGFTKLLEDVRQKRVKLTVAIGATTPAAPTGNATVSVCQTATGATLAGITGITGTAIKWYDAATGGNFIPTLLHYCWQVQIITMRRKQLAAVKVITDLMLLSALSVVDVPTAVSPQALYR